MNLEIFQSDKSVKISSGIEITCHELKWKQGVQFIKMLAKYLGELPIKGGELVLDQEKLVSLVTGTEELAQYLILNSVGDVDAAWLESMKMNDAMLVLETALQINVHPDFFVKARRISSHVASAVGIKKEAKKQEANTHAS